MSTEPIYLVVDSGSPALIMTCRRRWAAVSEVVRRLLLSDWDNAVRVSMQLPSSKMLQKMPPNHTFRAGKH